MSGFDWGRTYNTADRVIVPTGPMRELLLGYEVDSPISVIPTGVLREDFEFGREESARSILRWRELYPELRGKRVLLTAGRIGEEKNFAFILEVFKRLATTEPDLDARHRGRWAVSGGP